MRAIVRDSSTTLGLAFAEVAPPRPRPDELLVRMTATSLNYGTVAYLDTVQEASIRGSDGAGIVVQEAANGTGPSVGMYRW